MSLPHNTEGIFENIPAEAYRAAPGESNSEIGLLAVSPLEYHRIKTGQITREVTDAMERGTVMHASILEARREFHVRPETYGPDAKPWHHAAKECKAWMEAHSDKPVLTSAQAIKITQAEEYVRSHLLAGPLVCGGVSEVSIFARDHESGLLLKGRCDKLHRCDDYWTVVDLKTTQDASTVAFVRSIQTYRYHVQAAMYRRILLANGAPFVRFFFVALQMDELPLVNVRELNPRAMDLGDEVLDADLAFLKECRANNRWPEWRDSNPAGVGIIDLPERCYPEPELTGMTAGGKEAA